MVAPAIYSEDLFADYLASQFEPVASVLGWDAGSTQVLEAVNDALLDLGASSIAVVSDIRGLRAAGRRAIWRAVVQATAGDYSITDNGQKLERQQVNDQARKMLDLAESECRGLGIDPSFAAVATMIRVKRPHDPYLVLEDAERVL
jgi:hypothetical protein